MSSLPDPRNDNKPTKVMSIALSIVGSLRTGGSKNSARNIMPEL